MPERDVVEFLKAAKIGDIKSVKEYVKSGGDLNAQNDYGATGLTFAVIYKKLDVIKYLLECGANPRIANNKGNTPIKLAISKNLEEIIELFERYLDPKELPKKKKIILDKSSVEFDQVVLDEIRESVQKDVVIISKKLKSNDFGGADAFTNSVFSSRSVQQKRKLNSIYDAPFFGRLDFRNVNQKPESYYIGRYDYQKHIISNNNKVAELFYRKKIGKVIHDTLGHINMKLIRQFELNKGEIISAHDLTSDDVQFLDSILKKRLVEAASAELRDVVETIQEEQYQVISADERKPLIVQGSAGSGKTTIALHRISYLLYNNKSFSPDKIAIFGPNKMFMNYISNALPGIGVEGIKQTTFLDWCHQNINDLKSAKYTYKSNTDMLTEISKKNPEEQRNALRRNTIKGSLNFYHILQRYLHDIVVGYDGARFAPIFEATNQVVVKMVDEMELKFKVELDKEIFVNMKDRIHGYYKDYRYMPLLTRRERIIKNIESIKDTFLQNLKRKMFHSHTNIQNQQKDIIQVEKVISESIAAFKKVWQPLNAVELYFNLITKFENICQYIDIDNNIKEMMRFVEDNNKLYTQKNLEASDLAGIFIIDDFLNQGVLEATEKPFHYLIIDEGQDYNPLEVFLLSKIVGKGRITILGDLGQSIFAYRSISDWKDLTATMEAGIEMDTNYIELSSTYRSTNQITNYSNEIIQGWSKNKYTLSKPFGRDGNDVLYLSGANPLQKELEIEKIVRGFQIRGLNNIAIITRDKDNVKKVARKLKNIKNINLCLEENAKYDGGLIIMPVILSKGLEFDAVIVYDSSNYETKKKDSEKKLLYVACTRAMHELVVF
ncbi:DNA helicase-2/ATP-dependent DNA helicase PcrA [Bacillus tianshenii]|uniref:DNA helicase-2/ATP-dependent DNA helicase PcrA n=2 Tax=Sutcliffiella tianshenii TaxID=1463404 RepID=A0ABS2NZC2_9BACI|nr:DNA helicase-2/ATP-dependent DNA helicase PcrA [Bacillus tianshenii]